MLNTIPFLYCSALYFLGQDSPPFVTFTRVTLLKKGKWQQTLFGVANVQANVQVEVWFNNQNVLK